MPTSGTDKEPGGSRPRAGKEQSLQGFPDFHTRTIRSEGKGSEAELYVSFPSHGAGLSRRGLAANAARGLYAGPH